MLCVNEYVRVVKCAADLHGSVAMRRQHCYMRVCYVLSVSHDAVGHMDVPGE